MDDDSCNSSVQFRKSSNSINVTRKSVRPFKSCWIFFTTILKLLLLLFVKEKKCWNWITNKLFFLQGIVEWAADQPFSSRIQPIPVKEWNIHPQLIPGASCSPDLNVNYLIFGHPNTTNIVHDTIGFFIAKYRKICWFYLLFKIIYNDCLSLCPLRSLNEYFFLKAKLFYKQGRSVCPRRIFFSVNLAMLELSYWF